MVLNVGQREHVLDHYRRILPRNAQEIMGLESSRREWGKKEIAEFREGVEPYSREDLWLDQLQQLPSKEKVRALIAVLRNAELREVAEGILNDSTVACKSGDSLEVAKSINGWVATAEEIATSRRKVRYVLAARQRQRMAKAGKPVDHAR